MYRAGLTRLALAAQLGALLCACDEGGVCRPDALAAALSAARPGDVVRVGSCRIEGAFAVPAGVSVAGSVGSVLASVPGGAPVLDVDASASSTLTGMRIEVDHGGLGVRATGGSGGAVEVERVEVRVSRGIGMGVQAADATLREVTFEGPIDATNALFAPMSPAETGAFGLVARDLTGRTLSLDAVHVRGFAVAGVSVGGGTLSWQGIGTSADVEGNRGVGIALFGTAATLTSVEVTSMYAGVGLPGIGVSIAELGLDAGWLDAAGLTVGAGDGYGLFSSGADVRLSGARFRDLGLAGIRAQGGTISATDLGCERNGGAGLLAIDTVAVSIEGGHFDDQVVRGLASSISSVDIGDGIEVVTDPTTVGTPPLDLRLVDVTMSRNERAGLLLDAAGGAVARVELIGVEVLAEGASFGAVAQDTAVPAGWDAAVVRTGDAAANDVAFPGSLAVVGIMMPPGLVATPPSF